MAEQTITADAAEASLPKLVEELKISPRQIMAVARLLAEGNTIPFIARYRKEVHGNLGEVQIGKIQERLNYHRELDDRLLHLFTEKQPDRLILVSPLHKPVKCRKIEVQLSKIGWAELPHLQLDCDERAQSAMVEKEVYEELLVFKHKPLLTSHETEVVTAQCLYCLFDICNKRLGQNALIHVLVGAGIDIVEVDEFKQIFVTERADGACRLCHR